MTDHRGWLERLTNGTSVNAVAAKIGYTQTTLNDQVSGKSKLRPKTVVDIARAYGSSPVAALVEFGLIEEHEARDAAGLEPMLVEAALRHACDSQILEEIRRRLDRRRKYGGIDLDPDSEEF